MSKKEKISYPPQWCKYCINCTTYGRHYVCWQGNLLKFILFGPEIVNFDGTCKNFVLDKRYETNQKTR